MKSFNDFNSLASSNLVSAVKSVTENSAQKHKPIVEKTDTVQQAAAFLGRTAKKTPEISENVFPDFTPNPQKSELNEIRSTISNLSSRLSSLSLGGGGTGIVRIANADDIDRSTALVNNKYLKFNSSTGMFVGADGGGGGEASLPLANGTSNFDIALANGYVTVTANTFTWTFNETNGLLELAGNLANFSACSAINFVANSSGDGAGYSTIELRPDSNATLDQYLIIDPTAPGHIHIRAGGQQDNSNASLFLGGENSYFRVTGGANADVTISANSHQFVYGEFGYGVMRFPLRAYAELPQSPLIIAGQRSFVTDANLVASGNFGAVISGGGSNTVPVWSDGTNWRIG